MSPAFLWKTYVAIRVLQGILSMVGNGVTIAAVIRSANLRSPAHLLIVNLALSDFIHGLAITIVFPLKSFVVYFPAWKILCLTLQVLEGITALQQFCVIIMVSMERLMALRSKLGLSRVSWSMQFTVGLIVATWITVIIFILSLLITTQNIHPGVPCRMVLVFGEYYGYLSIALLLLATFSMLILNGKIAKIAWDSHKRQGHMTVQRKKDINITRMLAIVVGVFFLLFSPVLFMSFTVKLTSPAWFRFIYYITVLWSDISFWINPLIYVWRNKDFRTSIRNLFGRHFRGAQVGVLNNGSRGQEQRVTFITVPAVET